MDSEAEFKYAGPIRIDSTVLARDAQIREDNHADPIDDVHVREYVENNKQQIFNLQSTFFAELREKAK